MKKYFVPVIVARTADGPVFKMKKVSEETKRFLDWAEKCHTHAPFQYRKEQVEMLEKFFSLHIGEGKTTLLNLLVKYDK